MLRCRAVVSLPSSHASPATGSRSFARPKSRILTRPSSVTNTFSGLMSRWTMPFSCAAASPVATAIAVVDRLARHQGAVAEQVAQRLALQQLADDVGGAVVRAGVVDGEDVGVVQRRGGAGFLVEAAQAIGVGRVGRAAGS